MCTYFLFENTKTVVKPINNATPKNGLRLPTPNETRSLHFEPNKCSKISPFRVLGRELRALYRSCSPRCCCCCCCCRRSSVRTFLRNPPPPSLHPHRYYELFCCRKLSCRPVDRVVPACHAAAARHSRRSGSGLVRIFGGYLISFAFSDFTAYPLVTDVIACHT